MLFLQKNYIANPLPSYQNIQPYLAPNYDSIAQDVKGLFRQRLGRDPKPYEVGLLYDAYDSLTLASILVLLYQFP